MVASRFAVLGVLLCACGSNGSSTETARDAGLPSDATKGDDGTTGGGDSGSLFGDGGGDASVTFGCSGDLRSVVDQNGNVVQTCPPDEGCAAGKCIAACAAAAASHGSLGCDFWLSTPVITDRDSLNQQQPCFAVTLANTWPLPATLTLTRSGTTYDATKFAYIPSQTAPPAQWPALLTGQGIPVDNVAVVYLSGASGVNYVETGEVASCPQATATGDATMPTGTGKYGAFHVTTSVPVTAYDIYPFGGGQSGFPGAELLYPSSAWGTNYVVLATPESTVAPQRLKFVEIVAYENATNVTFSPAVALPGGGGYPAVAQNTSTTFTLNAGEYAHWETDPSSTDLSGSIVLANNPVSITAGEELFRLQPFEEPGGDLTHVQILPASAVGHDYAAAPYTTRRADLQEESIHYRIVGLVAGTQLTFDPALSSAPTSVGQSQVADFQTTGAFRVSSQDANHPFSIAQEMSTGNVNLDDAGGFRTDCATFVNLNQSLPKVCGDEEFVPLVAPAQFLSKYVFFTDPTYSTTSLALVRVKAAGAFQDVTVDCLGTIGGWQNIDAAGQYQYARADLLRAVPPGTVPDAGTCTNGRHVASSNGAFGLVVYGLDSYSSYGYPAGGNAAVLSGIVVQPPQ